MTTKLKHRQSFLALFVLLLLLSGCKRKNATAPTYPVTIINQSSHTVCSVKFYPSGSYLIYAKNLLKDSWFKKKTIPANQTKTLSVPKGQYDIRLKTCDGLMTGTDYFSVPERTSWVITDEQLLKPVQ